MKWFDKFISSKTSPAKTETVPSAPSEIREQAYAHRKDLKTITLPEGLEIIGRHAFWDCPELTEITIPASVSRICEGAFGYCSSLSRVTVLNPETIIEDGAFTRCKWGMELIMPVMPRVDQRLRMFGGTFLVPQRVKFPERDHTTDPVFRQLVSQCMSDDASAMWELGEWFLSLGEHPFYVYAASFWQYQACLYGDSRAEKWLDDWIRDNPDQRMRSLMNEYKSGTYEGEILRGCGFDFFESEREYSLSRPDKDGVVEVSSWSSTEGPDSDGFGMEECYDWWHLDSKLRELPGVPVFYDYSYNDKRTNEVPFQAARDKAARAIAARQK